MQHLIMILAKVFLLLLELQLSFSFQGKNEVHYSKFKHKSCHNSVFQPIKMVPYFNRHSMVTLHDESPIHNQSNLKSNTKNSSKNNIKHTKKYHKHNSQFSKYYDKDHKKYTNSRERSISKGMDPILSLNMNLDSLAKSKERGSADRAEQLLLRIEKLYQVGYYQEKPDVVSYNAVLNAWAKSRERHQCAQRAETLLQKMEERYACGDKDMKPNVISFNCVLNAFANSSQRGSAQRAEEMLHQMEEMYLAGNKNVKPNKVSYHSVMNAYASSKKEKGSVDKARKLFDKMVQIYESGLDDAMKPNLRTFNTLFKAYANINTNAHKYQHTDDTKNLTVKKINELLLLMQEYKIQPDPYTFGSITKVYANMGNAKSAESILYQMEHMYKKGNKRMRPNKFIFSSIINAYANANIQFGNQYCNDDIDTVLTNGEKAEKILEKMETMANDDEDYKPDVVCYTGVIHAYASTPISTSTFSSDPAFRTKIANKAEAVFHHMESLYERENNNRVKPNIHTCCAVINALSIDGAFNRAEQIIHKLEKYNLTPNKIIYNALLKTLAKSPTTIEKSKKALNIMHYMRELHRNGNRSVAPDIITYNSVLLCAAYSLGDTEEKREAMTIVLNVFNEIYESSERNQMTSITYGLFILACRKLIPAGVKGERLSTVKQVFDLCCENGKLSNEVIHQVKRALPYDQWYIVFEQSKRIDDFKSLTILDLPSEWSQNNH